MEIHQEMVRTALKSDLFVSNALVDMYVIYGSIEVTRHVFDKMPEPDTVSWTNMITGYVQAGQLDEHPAYFNRRLGEMCEL